MCWDMGTYTRLGSIAFDWKLGKTTICLTLVRNGLNDLALDRMHA